MLPLSMPSLARRSRRVPLLLVRASSGLARVLLLESRYMASAATPLPKATGLPEAQPTLWQRLGTLLASGIFAAVAFLFRRYGLDPGLASFWDAHVYTAAFRSSAAHQNAYDVTASAPFVYPPLFLHLGAFVYQFFHGPPALHVFVGVNFLALLLSAIVLSMYYFPSRWLTPPLAVLLFTFAPAFVAEGSFFTGNLANILYAALLLAGIAGVKQNRWLGFYLVLACAGFIKLPMLAFLLLPLLLGSGQALGSVLTVVCVFALNVLTRLTDGVEYAAYLEALHTQIVVHHDLGYGLVYSLSRLLLRHPALPAFLPYAAQALMAGTVVALLLLLRSRKYAGVTRSQSVAAVILAALLCNPRLQAYDLDQFVVPSVYLLVEVFLACRRRPLSRALSGATVFVLLVLSYIAPQKAIYLTGLVGICVLAAAGLASTTLTRGHSKAAA